MEKPIRYLHKTFANLSSRGSGAIAAALVGFLVVDSGLANTSDVAETLEVSTESGIVKGRIEGRTRVFRGIPYAAPPVGTRRWRPPQPAQTWDGIRDAGVFGPLCPQGGGWITQGRGEEDCLRLNIWTPAAPSSERFAVMVWIHGGGFEFGGASNPTFDGRRLSERGSIIVVSLNYRLGVLGFLALKELSAESATGSSGAYGLLDQVAALQWIQRNIAAFGGNADEVTIFGESAGSMSVCQHLISPLSRGLFHRAILQSGTCLYRSASSTDQSLAEFEKRGREVVRAADCEKATAVLACLRAMDAHALIASIATKGNAPGGNLLFADPRQEIWGPPFVLIDGEFLTAPIIGAAIDGRIADVPIIIGSVKDEGTSLLENLPENAKDYYTALRHRYGDRAEAVKKEYPLDAYDRPATALAEVLGDELFACPTVESARLLSLSGRRVYLYRLEQVLENLFDPWLGAFHTSDLAFIFGNDHWRAKLGSADRGFSQTVMGYWLNFVKTGDPNDSQLPNWPPFLAETGDYLVLKQPVRVGGANPKEQKCEFWRQFLRWPKA